ncbi:MAG: PaaI family thioesterase [Pseudomonadota bacterium]
MGNETAFAVRNEHFERDARQHFAAHGLMRQLGAWLVSVEPGASTIELPMSQRVTQHDGYFHGAALGAIGDTAGGFAAFSLFEPGDSVVTVEYKINFIRPARGALLRATGSVLRVGKSLTTVTVSLESGAHDALEPCALMLATMARVPAQRE